MRIVIHSNGDARCLYSETLNLKSLGSLSIRRASHVEPDEQGRWIADLAPMDGPCLGPFDQRYQALSAEAAWREA
ncbi:MAG: hypothetical protein N2C14_19810, partial [Planctomycetales bacterium]